MGSFKRTTVREATKIKKRRKPWKITKWMRSKRMMAKKKKMKMRTNQRNNQMRTRRKK